MKQIFQILLITGLMNIGFSSCEKDDLVPPVIYSFTVDKTEIKAEESVIFSVDTNADLKVIWPGDAGRNYENRQADIDEFSAYGIAETHTFSPSNVGFSFSGKTYTCKYLKAGIFTAVLEVTNFKDFSGKKEMITKSIQIKVLPKE